VLVAELRTRLWPIVEPIAEEEGLELVEVEFVQQSGNWVLRIYLDKPGGVQLDDCERVSRRLSPVLDVEDLIPHRYVLEVSSPGLERELRKEREFRWAMGKAIQCWVSKSVGGRTLFTGHLRGITEEALSLEEPDGQLYELPRGLVTKARLAIELPLRRLK